MKSELGICSTTVTESLEQGHTATLTQGFKFKAVAGVLESYQPEKVSSLLSTSLRTPASYSVFSCLKPHITPHISLGMTLFTVPVTGEPPTGADGCAGGGAVGCLSNGGCTVLSCF